MDFLRIGPSERFDSPEIRVLTLLGKRVGVWRGEDGAWHAMEMDCRHQNGDLSLGRRDGDIVVCPRHGWRYDLASGACLTEAWAALRRYDIREEDGSLFVSARPLPEPPA